MEGKEVRFGIGGSTLTAVVTPNTATGSYNSMDDSYTSLGGMVLLLNMLLGELVFEVWGLVYTAWSWPLRSLCF
jgi:K+-transporting ATPase ATPase A chain